MTGNRMIVWAVFFACLPLIVAYFGLSVAVAAMLVVAGLVWRWLVVLSGLLRPANVPELELETIPPSHYSEKVRWCMDRIGEAYKERQIAGILGIFFRGRTVPQLSVRTGRVRSVIGNSSDILRYLFARYKASLGDRVAFLDPTPARVALEERIDKYAFHLQVWSYYHVLPKPLLVTRLWGRNSPLVPWWQRCMLLPLYPVLRAFLMGGFGLTEKNYAAALGRIEKFLKEIDDQLSDGRHSILESAEPDFADISFASITGVWIQPEQYGGGMADSCRMDRKQMPSQMRAEVDRWTENYPHVIEFVERIYREERVCSPTAAS